MLYSTPVLIIIVLDYLEIWIPRFCYHGKLSSSGNCRMCLVEIKGSLKPLIACCTLYNKNMVVYNNTDLVRRSREFIMEFLLINHPLDCPICDQAGECDLQDLSLIYGSDDSRYEYDKKAILNKNVGGLIKTNMNRCIYCTRCVRYTSELNNVHTFSTLGRGGYSEISNYIKVDNETHYIDGNVIDLCPVGALTSKPYLFRNRTWELSSVESIDILDSLCSNIRIDTINNVIERILPKPNNNLNEDWITDKIRFCYDGFKKQRISFPSYKNEVDNQKTFVSSSWFYIFSKISIKYNTNKNYYLDNSFIALSTGHLLDFFSLYLIKIRSQLLGINNINLNSFINTDLRKYYLFNSSIRSLDYCGLFLFLGVNPKVDSPIFNLKIRTLKFKFNNQMNVCHIGNRVSLNYSFTHLGVNLESFLKLLFGKIFFSKHIYNSSKLYSFSSIFIEHFDKVILGLESNFSMLYKHSLIFNTLTLFSSDVSLCEMSLYAYYYARSTFIRNNNIKIVYLIGVDYNNMYVNNKFCIYQGHHGNIGLKYADIVLPSNTFVENIGFYMNCEGRFLISNLAITKKKKMSNNETIINNIFNMLSHSVGKLESLYIFILFFYKMPLFFNKYKFVHQIILNVIDYINIIIIFSRKLNISYNRDYYSSDVISKTSYFIHKLKYTKHNF